MKRLALLSASLLSLTLASPALAQAPQAPSLDALTPAPLQFTHRTLANGLNVYAMPESTAGTVTVQVWYDVGAKNDPAGRSGFAHLFEHILSRKTINMPLGTMNALTEDVGGTRNASTGADFTNYYETVPPQYLETMLWTHAERMARPVVDEAVFKAERDIVKEVERYITNPGQATSYKIGELKIEELRDKARAALGDRFDIKAFHAVVLGSGSVPLDVLEEQVNAWIATRT